MEIILGVVMFTVILLALGGSHSVRQVQAGDRR